MSKQKHLFPSKGIASFDIVLKSNPRPPLAQPSAAVGGLRVSMASPIRRDNQMHATALMNPSTEQGEQGRAIATESVQFPAAPYFTI